MTARNSLAQAADLAEALALMTRLPVPAHTPRGAAAAWAWPLAGAAVGGLAGVVALVALALGLPPALAAGFALATEIALTGALHEDGLADTADGLWGGHDRARRLAIMKDSRIGSYGVLALGLSLILRWSALTALAAAGPILAAMIAVGALSRAPMALTMAALPPARPGGLAAAVGRPPWSAGCLGAALTALMALGLLGIVAIPAALAVAAVSFGLARLARARIGGQTGDILGAMQQVAAVVALAVLCAAPGP